MDYTDSEAELEPVPEPVSAWRAFHLIWISLVAVTAWPAMGIAMVRHLFDYPSEAVLVFGGLISCLLYIPAMLWGGNDTLFTASIGVVWVLLWLGPMVWLIRHPRGLWDQLKFVAVLSGLSLAQATLGCLMIIGKGV